MTAVKRYDLAQVNTATTGTGTMTLGSPVAGFLSFANAGASDGDTVNYAISDGSNAETGQGTYNSAGPTLTRATVFKSTNSNALISLSGSAKVAIAPLAEDLALANLNDVSMSPGSGTDGYSVTWNNTAGKFELTSITGGGASALSGLSDVDITGTEGGIATSTQVLMWNESAYKWQGTKISIGVNVADIAMGFATSLADGDVLMYHSGLGKWYNTPFSGGATTLHTLTDVNVTEGSGIDGYSLTWSNSTSKWVATLVSGGGTTNYNTYNVVSVNGNAVSVAKLATDQSMANGSWTAVAWDTNVIDDTGGINIGSHPTRITVPSGMSRVRLSAYISFANNSTGSRYVSIRKNGSTTIQQSIKPAANESGITVLTEWMAATAADYFEVLVDQTSGGAPNIAGFTTNDIFAPDCYFQAEWISTTLPTAVSKNRNISFNPPLASQFTDHTVYGRSSSSTALTVADDTALGLTLVDGTSDTTGFKSALRAIPGSPSSFSFAAKIDVQFYAQNQAVGLIFADASGNAVLWAFNSSSVSSVAAIMNYVGKSVSGTYGDVHYTGYAYGDPKWLKLSFDSLGNLHYYLGTNGYDWTEFYPGDTVSGLGLGAITRYGFMTQRYSGSGVPKLNIPFFFSDELAAPTAAAI